MTNIFSIAEKQTLDVEATLWVTKLDGRRLSASEFAAFQTWVNTSEAHQSAFDQAASMWGSLDLLGEMQGALTAATTVKWHSKVAAGLAALMPKPRYGIAAAMMLAVAGLSIMSATENQPQNSAAIYATAIGENKSIKLSDGSEILLNTGSQVEVRFSKERRTLNLVKGEAHFAVAHNASRPFEVQAGTNIVRAIGTAFTVELNQETVEVTVTEGQVELATIAQADDASTVPQETSLALVNSGQSAKFSTFIRSIDTISKDEVTRRLAWHKGALIFKGEALEDVMEEASRYTKTKFVISDPKIRSLKVGGYFKTGETRAMLQAIEANFGVSVKWVGTDLVYLSQSVSE